jgi:hypothetical protein
MPAHRRVQAGTVLRNLNRFFTNWTQHVVPLVWATVTRFYRLFLVQAWLMGCGVCVVRTHTRTTRDPAMVPSTRRLAHTCTMPCSWPTHSPALRPTYQESCNISRPLPGRFSSSVG